MDRPGRRSSAPLLPSALLLLALLSQGLGQLCTLPAYDPLFPEDTPVGHEIITVTVTGDDTNVTLALVDDLEGTFRMQDKSVILNKPLDYESADKSYSLVVRCKKGDETTDTGSIVILVGNVNDNPPVFEHSIYDLMVDELLPVDTPVRHITATDPDGGTLYFRIDPPQDYFKLQSVTTKSVNILMNKLLDYDTVKNIEFNLIVQDTETSTPPSYTATAKVIITVKDVDNRPPWFQPCTPEVIGQAKVCLNTGYTGQVILTQQAPGPLPLKPESLRAVDGDEFIKALISYRLLTVSDIFAVNENTGEITMKKAADVAGPIVLTVMAYQTLNADRFATTTVTFEVKNTNNSLHPPTFEKASYDGYISLDAGVGSLVLEGEHSSKPLQLQATDQDFADGLNPFMKYELQGSSEFSITQQGFIIMTRAAAAGAVSFQVRAVDTESGEEAETAVKLEVSPETPSTTAMPSTTTDMPTTTTDMPTTSTDMPTTTDMPSTSTAMPSSSTGMTSSISPQTTTDPVIQVPGTYRVEDMVAVGVPLGILLLIAVVMIALLAVYINGHKKDASKIKEVSHFHSNLESGGGFGLKGGVHYSNKGFQGDGDDDGDDGDSMASDEPDRARAVEAPISRAAAAPLYETTRDDTASIAESSKSEKEVKPILTKERKDDEGYKAVWFKQDIDPQVEVSIIPERTEQEDDDDDDEDEDALGGYASRRGVQFTDDDVDDGSVQGEDEDENSDLDDHLQRREEDDDDDRPQTSDL